MRKAVATDLMLSFEGGPASAENRVMAACRLIFPASGARQQRGPVTNQNIPISMVEANIDDEV